jgi:hypothetical protein
MKFVFTLLLASCFLISNAQIPKLNSYPSAAAVIFLDFDGQTVQSAYWNGGNTITCASPNIPNAVITEAFNRVSEDYKIFNINVTTDSTVFLAAPLTKRIRIIITPTNFFVGGAGSAYVNSFSWGDDTPGFVFANSSASAKFLGEACSHESGHSLGCSHQSVYDIFCTKISEYNYGQGSGEIGWAPIMGYSVDKVFSTWHNGKRNINCVDQNDIEVIASRIDLVNGFKIDDLPNGITNAPSINQAGINLSATGLVNNSTDIDYFKLIVPEPSKLFLKGVTPLNIANQNYGNLDMLVSLHNASGSIIKSYNTLDSLSAKIDTTLNTGTYYISVDGTSNINSGTDYGSEGSFALAGTIQTLLSLPIQALNINGEVNNGNHVIHWNIEANEPIVNSFLEYSTNGTDFSTLQQIDYRANVYSYKPFTSNAIYYRMKSFLRNGSYKASNIITLQSAKSNEYVQILNNNVNDQLLIIAKERIAFQLIDMNGKIMTKGNLLPNQVNKINTAQMGRGLYILKTMHNNYAIAQRIIKN